MSLGAWVFESAARHNGLCALSIDKQSISYRELTQLALHIASALLAQGAQSEAVGIVGQRQLDSYAGVLGILYAGCHYVPIHPRSSPQKLIHVIQAAGIRFLVGAQQDLQRVYNQLQEHAQHHLILRYMSLSGESDSSGVWSSPDTTETPAMTAPVVCQGDELAYILFTSGSTGQPKGVKVSHNNVIAYLQAIQKLWMLEPGYRASQFHDFSFDPSVSDMFTTWTLGGELCVVPESELMMPAHFIRRMELAVWSSVPAIGNFMQKLGVLKEDAFPSLQITRFAGEPLSLRMAKVWQSAAPNSTVENHYGPTESTIDVARYVYQPSAAESLFSNGVVPIGHAFPGTDIKIVDENNQPVASEVQGQIIFKGPQVSKGYLDDDIKTQSAFVQFEWDTSHAIWFKSGDLGFINAHGSVECLGRMDSQIKFSGKRVEIGEIEAALSRFDALSDVVVVAVKDAQGVVSELVGFTASELSAQALASIKQSSRQWLDPLFFPKRILTLAQLPYAVSGKVDRRTLADMALKASKH